MKEHPLICKDSVLRNIMAGIQTQDRRPVKGLEDWRDMHPHESIDGVWLFPDAIGNYAKVKSPFGAPGDRLWVRECFNPHYFGYQKPGYRADYDAAKVGDVVPEPKWTPSIHMPRWACRTTLLVKRVWVHRIQDITEEDAIAEGVDYKITEADAKARALSGHDPYGVRWNTPTPREAFRGLWESIYPGSWERNYWVWACEFEREDAT